MSRTYHHGERRIRVRGIKRDQPDLRRIARALIEFAQAEAEQEAEALHKKAARSATTKPKTTTTEPPTPGDAT
jgi:hypothetical protein